MLLNWRVKKIVLPPNSSDKKYSTPNKTKNVKTSFSAVAKYFSHFYDYYKFDFGLILCFTPLTRVTKIVVLIT